MCDQDIPTREVMLSESFRSWGFKIIKLEAKS
jgi:hypothetical protein